MSAYITILLIILSFAASAKDEKAAEKNRRIVEKEEARFHKDLARHSDTGRIYYEHARNLSEINSESNRALGFYRLALKYDSTNASLYRDYGRYLFERQRSYHESRKVLDVAFRMNPGDTSLRNDLIVVNRTIDMVEAEDRLRDFGTFDVLESKVDTSYYGAGQYDSLRNVVVDTSNLYSYKRLLKRFLADDRSLTSREMFMLIIGYSRQPEYNPFNYNDISEVKMLSGHDPDAAIEKGTALMQTNPLNPSLYRELMYSYRKKNDPQRAEKYLSRIKQFFSGVLYSGNGTCAHPYVSLWAKEEYNFLNYLGYKTTDEHAMGSCAGKMAEIIYATNSAGQKEQAYFNVSLIYTQTVGK
jgi:hypothetical protein